VMFLMASEWPDSLIPLLDSQLPSFRITVMTILFITNALIDD